ncbi:hypothetical protein ACIRQY_18645 [Streptomyces sp. NPDC101490]|uniref:hypothetical protein n=1 Tax=Streptomyces sp. NPDC101490 TaxID=3366143 RepID=UPI00381EB063
MIRATSRTSRIRLTLLAAAGALMLSGCTTVVPDSSVTSGRAAQDTRFAAAEPRLVVECPDDRVLALTARPRAPDVNRTLRAESFGIAPGGVSLTATTLTVSRGGCLTAARGGLHGDRHGPFLAGVPVGGLQADARSRTSSGPAAREALVRRADCAPPSERPYFDRPYFDRPELGGPYSGRPGPADIARCDPDAALAAVRARLEAVRPGTVRALRHGEPATYRELRARALRRAAEPQGPATLPEKATSHP